MSSSAAIARQGWGRTSPPVLCPRGVATAAKKTPLRENRRNVTLGRVAAHLKLTGTRELRLLALIEAGEPLAAACRATMVSRQTVYRHARDDAAFAVLLRRAREHRAPVVDDGAWREAAAQLEQLVPERWAPPEFSPPSA